MTPCNLYTSSIKRLYVPAPKISPNVYTLVTPCSRVRISQLKRVCASYECTHTIFISKRWNSVCNRSWEMYLRDMNCTFARSIHAHLSATLITVGQHRAAQLDASSSVLSARYRRSTHCQDLKLREIILWIQREVRKENVRSQCENERTNSGGASGLPYYCAPLLCISAVIGLLAVWRHNKPKSKTRGIVWLTFENQNYKSNQWNARIKYQIYSNSK